MAASSSDKARKSYSFLQKTLNGAITDVATTLTPNNVTNIPTDTAVTFIIDRVDSNGTATPTLREIVTGIVSGGTIASLTRGQHGTTAQAHSSGAVIEFVHAANIQNDLVDFLLQDHANPSGYHKTLTDTNGNEWIKQTATSSAVNEITVTNAATTTAPKIQATGDDTNIDLYVGGKGTGAARWYGNHDGWTLDTDTWTYVSATSFKITGKDVSARFPAGTRVKLTQTTAKYFVVTSSTFSTDTTVNITGGTDYTLANASITSPSYSYAISPQGYPDYFAYTPTWTNFTVGSSTQTIKFQMYGKTVVMPFYMTQGSGSSMGSSPSFTLPVTASSSLVSGAHVGAVRLVAGGTAYKGWFQFKSTADAYVMCEGSAGSYVNEASISSTIPNTWGTAGSINGMVIYQAA